MASAELSIHYDWPTGCFLSWCSFTASENNLIVQNCATELSHFYMEQQLIPFNTMNTETEIATRVSTQMVTTVSELKMSVLVTWMRKRGWSTIGLKEEATQTQPGNCIVPGAEQITTLTASE